MEMMDTVSVALARDKLMDQHSLLEILLVSIFTFSRYLPRYLYFSTHVELKRLKVVESRKIHVDCLPVYLFYLRSLKIWP